MRGIFALGFGALMFVTSVVILYAACQPGLKLGLTFDGASYDLSPLVIATVFVQGIFWIYVIVLGVADLIHGKNLTDKLQIKTEQTLSRAANAIRNVILDWDPSADYSEDREKPELGAEPLPPLDPCEFVGSMRRKVEERLAQVAEAINAAQTGQEIAGKEEQIKTALNELRFDAIALGLQMRNDAADAGLLIAGATPAAGSARPLGTRSGRAKSFAASEYWRPVWVERYRNMRATDTAFRLAERSRRRSVENN